MSANNWRECPKCFQEARKVQARLVEAVKTSYGVVPVEEYLAMKAKADLEISLEETLREDWEISTHTDGEFFFSYRCSCQSCGFEFSFKHEENTLKK